MVAVVTAVPAEIQRRVMAPRDNQPSRGAKPNSNTETVAVGSVAFVSTLLKEGRCGAMGRVLNCR